MWIITVKSYTFSDEKRGTMQSEGLKMGFVENKRQSGPLSVVNKTLSVIDQILGDLSFVN